MLRRITAAARRVAHLLRRGSAEAAGRRVADGLEGALREAGLRPVQVELREYRFVMSLDDYVDGRTTAVSGRFLRDMLDDEAWGSFLDRARAVFRERFPDPLTDFRQVNLAVATKPADYAAADAQRRR